MALESLVAAGALQNKTGRQLLGDMAICDVLAILEPRLPAANLEGLATILPRIRREAIIVPTALPRDEISRYDYSTQPRELQRSRKDPV